MLRHFFRNISNYINTRLIVLGLIFIGLGSVLVYRVFNLQVVNGAGYLDQFSLKIRKEVVIPSTRGNIYDCNGKLLAYNELAYSVTIEDVYESGKSKNTNINATLLKTIRMIEENNNSIISDFNIYLDKNGQYQFSVSDTKLKRFLADIYGHALTDDLKEKELNATPLDVMDYLATRYEIGERTDPDDKTTFVPGSGYSRRETLQLVIIRYAMKANTYQKYIPTTIATNVSEETVAAIKENNQELLGIDIAEDTIRRYVDGTFFSHIIGYTGKASTEDLKSLNAEETKEDRAQTYDQNDTVGKSGIEKVMESYLQGKKGSRSIYVDNLGREIETESEVEPVAGGDVYLSVDSDLTEAVYHILEQRIAGILAIKIENIKEYNAGPNASPSLIRIPIYDVYSALFNNNIIDIEHLGSGSAKTGERAVYETFLQGKQQVLGWLNEELYTNNTPYSQLDKEHQAYASYIVTSLLGAEGGILKADSSDETYNKWSVEESISLGELLDHAISMNWIDVTRLNIENKYADSDEVFRKLEEYITVGLENNDFYKILYKYMLLSDRITGKDLCMLLIEQGIVTVSDEELAALEGGSTSAYSFMLKLIETLRITPAQLALDPFSGSCVVTDVNTGEVKALVSYPSYDNNRLANGIDADYYASLQSDLSKPLWDYATQMRTAPGSTYKMVTATTALMEGTTNTSLQVNCNGYFTRFTDYARKCWIAPGGHGNLNISGAIANSCNIYFYEMGYRMGLEDADKYNSDIANAKMRIYAQQYGLTDKSGVEIEESTPLFSENEGEKSLSVLSAIGQGTHSYTTVGLARYVTTVANSGTCYNLSLLDKVTDHNGNLLKDYSPEVRNTMELPTANWDAIHIGMRGVAESKRYFNDISVNMAGKTGTAQESKTRPNHALFVGYAPYEKPEISIAVRIAYGYSSDYAAQIAGDVMRYHFNTKEEEELLTGTAVRPDAGISAGD